MTKVTEALMAAGADRCVFACDFTPPRGSDPDLLDGARYLTKADFVCVAYNPGKLVRVDSVAAAYALRQRTGREVVFNLSPRDMNRLALESRLLGAGLLGLENVLVVQGDAFTDRDGVRPVRDYSATGLIRAAKQLNQGLDHRGARLRSDCDFCIGASIDLSRGMDAEARLVAKKVEAGADFLVSQPVFDVALVSEFIATFERISGGPLAVPILWGLQILAPEGVLFHNVPQDLLRDLERGRDGVDIALETYALFREAGIGGVYLVSPILRGGARDYEAAGRFLDQAV